MLCIHTALGGKMIKIELCEERKLIPFLTVPFELSFSGSLYHEDKNVDLSFFNKKTGLSVRDIETLLLVTFHRFNWGPSYWSQIKPLFQLNGSSSPENLLIGINEPVESLEYPGFYLIPYFSNYVVSPEGILIKKSTGDIIVASKGQLGYYTFRMTGDDGKTQNQLRHRILCYAFKPYPANVEELDVNHKNGIPGSDSLDNLEWVTRTENMVHAYAAGLRSDNKPVEVRDINQERIYIFESCSAAGRALEVTETTVSNRAKTNGYKAYNGFQFRFHPTPEPWPEINSESGNFLVEFPDGKTKRCTSIEAARLVGVTRTSLMRLLREGRNQGTNENKVTKLSV